MDGPKQRTLDVNVHRRILEFLNAARRPEDLMVPPPHEMVLVDEKVMHADELLHRDHDHLDEPHAHPGAKKQPKVEPLLERAVAKRVLQARNDYNPLLGFRHISQLQQIRGINRDVLDRLIVVFSPRFRGRWELLYADAD